MKYIIYILFLSCIGLSATAQLPSSTFPSRIFNGNTKAQWIILDSPVVNPILDTFNARYPGTQLVRIQGGDTAFWFGAGGHLWFRSLLSRDTVSLSNRINLKLNISDTIGKWLAQSTRLVDTMYRVNDSTIGYTIKGNPYTFQILGRSSGGGGGGTGTVTSVALSMPSAFSVSGSPITTNGTFNVSGAGTTPQYIRGNGTLATTDTGMIPNFYLKVRGLLTGTSPVTFNQTTGAIGINNANTTGTKGAASFTSAFSDNGSGLIDLANIVSTGSCTNCSVTYNAKGQATAYSSGIAPSGSSVDTIFRTPGVDSIYYTINSVQYAIKDSAGTTVTASNGLQKVGNDIRLGAASGPGAPLIYDSYIDAGSFQLNISGANGSNAVLSSSNSSGGYGLEGASSSASGAGIHAVNTSGGIGLSAEVLAGKALYLTAISGIPLYAVGQPSNANGNSVMAEFHRQTSGTATSGIAQSFDYWSQLSNGTNDTIARVAITTTTATAGSQSGAYDIWLKNNGGSLSRVSRITSSGQQVWDGYPALTAQTDTTNIKPIGYNTSTGVIQPMVNWTGGGVGTIYTGGNGISVAGNTISQLFVPLKGGSPVVGNSFSKGCCPDGTYAPYWDTLSKAFLSNVNMVNLGISGIGVRKGAYQLFTNFGESHPNVPILFEIGFNNTRILTDTATHNATIQAAYKSMVLSQFLIHIEAPNWGASGTNPNITYSNSSSPASSEDTLLNWQSRLYWFRHNTINTGANWFNKASCNNDTITIRNFRGPNIGFGTFAYYNTVGSRIKINVDGADVLTYNPNSKTYTGQAEGFTPDGIIPDAFTVMGLTDSLHTVKVIFIDNGKRGALDYFGTLCSSAESYDRPVYVLAFPHMNATGYAYPGGETTQGILDSASSALKGALRGMFPGYAMSFVDINANGFYNPLDISQIDQDDGIHPTSAGHYQIARAIYSTMLKSDKGDGITLDQALANGNTSLRQILLTGQNTGLPSLEVGNDLFFQTFANSNSWVASNLYFDMSSFRYKHNGVGAQVYFNTGYIEEKTAPSGSAGASATINTRKVVTPSGDVWLGGNITNSISGTGAVLKVNNNNNVNAAGVMQIAPVTSLGAFTPLMALASGTQPILTFYNSAGGTNEKFSDITLGLNTIDFRLGNDTYSSAVDWLTVTRSGVSAANVYYGLGEVNIGSATDQGSYTLQNTGGLYQNGAFYLKTLTAPPSTYNVIVHGLTDSLLYQVPLSSISATTIYNGDGTLAGARLVSTGGNTLTVSGANNSDTVMVINNTGTTGLGLHVSGTALGINVVSSAGTGLQVFGSTRGAIITGDTDEGLLVKSNAVRGARIQTVPSSTNTVVEVLQLERGSSGGAGATGIGEYISFLNKTSTNSSDVSNTIVSKFTDGTTATRTSQFAITGVNNASAVTLMTLDGNGNATFGTTNSIVGAATNNSAVAGNIGEEINATVSTYTNYTTTATYQNVTSITLTAGDWDITAQGTLSSNGATITAANDAIFVISTTTASASGATEGKNISYIPQAALLGTSHESTSIVPFRVSLSGTTTYYLNTQASFTVGNPQFTGTIRARRAR
jgi:hypothetical protein